MKQETKKLFDFNEQSPILSNIGVDDWWAKKKAERKKAELEKLTQKVLKSK